VEKTVDDLRARKKRRNLKQYYCRTKNVKYMITEKINIYVRNSQMD
jgi:hypothetical protein